MSIEALITGKVHKAPTERTGKSGRAFVTTTVRAAAGEGEALFVNVVAFSESACRALLALKEGDAVALAGSLTPKVWTDRDGLARPSLDLVAAQVMTLYGIKRKREASMPTDEASPAPPPRQGPGRGTQHGEQHQPGDDFGGDFGPQDWPEDAQ